MAVLTVNKMGQSGVNVDKDPLEIGDDELILAQNVTYGSTYGLSSIIKREGLLRFTTTATAGTVLGGVDLPEEGLNPRGLHYIYIGRGPT